MATKDAAATERDVGVEPQLVTDPGAVAISSTIGGARRIFNLGNGLKCSHVEITFTNAALAMPVGGTLSLPPAIWPRMGFQKIFAIPEITMVTSAGALLMGQPRFDPTTNVIRLVDVAGAAIPAATFGNGGKIRCLTFGI